MFCTTGVLLRRLQNDPFLSKVTHIIIDEVHERNLETDFLLLILKKLTKTRKDLKIILMSATFNSQLFSNYFSNAPVINIEGISYPVKEFFLEDVINMTNYVLDPLSHYSLRKQQRVNKVQSEIKNKCSNSTVRTLEELDFEKINYELIELLISYISNNQNNLLDGSLLIFLPGINEISKLEDILKKSSLLKKSSCNFLFFVLHSSISSDKQMKVFEKPPPNTFKIIVIHFLFFIF